MTASNQKSSYLHGDLKSALLDETASILREEGEDALPLRRLAANPGVSRTAPYNHFKNKEALLSAVAEEGFSHYAAAMETAQKRRRMLDGVYTNSDSVKQLCDAAADMLWQQLDPG